MLVGQQERLNVRNLDSSAQVENGDVREMRIPQFLRLLQRPFDREWFLKLNSSGRANCAKM
jgi:hypothetical protein